MCWEFFLIRVQIFGILLFRFFNPWDSFFFNTVVFDIWYIARNTETLVELADGAPTLVVGDSDVEELLLDEDEATDSELKSTLALVRRGTPRSAGNDSAGAVSKAREGKVKFAPRMVRVKQGIMGDFWVILLHF